MKALYIMIVLFLPLATVTAKTKEKLLLHISHFEANASITGTVIDSAGDKPVDFATVSVLDQRSGKVMSGSLADANGKFSISKLTAGTHQPNITFIVYVQ